MRRCYASMLLEVISLSVWHTRALWQTNQRTVYMLIPQTSTYNIATVRDSEEVQLWQILSRPRASQRATDGMHNAYVTPKSPNGWLKKRFCHLKKIKVNCNRIKSATKFPSVKTSSSKVVVRPFPYPALGSNLLQVTSLQ